MHKVDDAQAAGQFCLERMQLGAHLHRDALGQFLLAVMRAINVVLVIAPAQCEAGQNDRTGNQHHESDQQPPADGMALHAYSPITYSACRTMSSGTTRPIFRAATKLSASRFSAISTGRSPGRCPLKIWSAMRAA